MRRTLKLLFWTIEINLILWVVALGAVFSADEHGPTAKSVVAVGLVFAMLAQHWAYYAVYKRAQEMQ